jgi:hypothetical protein
MGASKRTLARLEGRNIVGLLPVVMDHFSVAFCPKLPSYLMPHDPNFSFVHNAA